MNLPSPMRQIQFAALVFAALWMAACSGSPSNQPVAETKKEAAREIFHVDPATAGVVSGSVKFSGKVPPPKPIDMGNDPTCVALHQGKAVDESLVASQGELAN